MGFCLRDGLVTGCAEPHRHHAGCIEKLQRAVGAEYSGYLGPLILDLLDLQEPLLACIGKGFKLIRQCDDLFYSGICCLHSISSKFGS